MGFAPPPDFPAPSAQDQATVDAGFEPSPSGASLCGFGIPGFKLNIRIPGFKFPPVGFPPKLSFSLALACDLSNPFSASVGFGGGRVSTADRDATTSFEDG